MRTRRASVVALTAVVLVVLTLFGGLLVALGLARLAPRSPVAHGVTTTGTVVSVSRVGTGSGTDYRPTIAFTTAAGTRVTFVGGGAERPPPDGAVVRVSYDPARPTHAHELRTTTGERVEIALGAILLALALGIALQLTWERVRRRAI
jgi:hypothetical protein